MKKIAVSLFTVAVAMSLAYGGFNAKKMACEKSCKKALQDCKKKAKGDKVKITACEVSYKKCMDKCCE